MKKINLKKAIDALDAYNRAISWNEWTARVEWKTEDEQAAARAAAIEAGNNYRAVCSELLDEAIKAAEGKATARTIKAEDVVSRLAWIFDNIGITKKAMQGVTVWIDLNAQKFPGAYKYEPQSTQVQAEYKGGAWTVTDIRRRRCSDVGTHVDLTDAAKAAILARYAKMDF